MSETTRRAPVGRLRAWQAAALDRYMATSPRDFLAVATPGAGKTTFALTLATELIARGIVDKLTVVCPTEHLKGQWASSAARFGIHIDPDFTNSQGVAGSHFDGVAVTYAQIGSNPAVHAARTRAYRTLVILDEIHHAGDSLSWGDGVREAFTDATRRLALTGTPFRSDTSPIPFVTYEEDEEGIRRSRADYTYGYGDALKDGVVRPVLFMSYSGQMAWRTSAGDEVSARLGEPLTKDMMKQAWRTALDPKGEWIPAVLRAADMRLEEVRRAVPDAGGLVIASNQEHARAYARHLRLITGKAPTIVLSDDADASDRISEFADSTDKWMVAVRMVSEGVDVPRLAVGVYATNAVLRPGDRPLRASPAPRRDGHRLHSLRRAPADPRRRHGGRTRPCARPSQAQRGQRRRHVESRGRPRRGREPRGESFLRPALTVRGPGRGR